MSWHILSLANGKTALINFSKVMYATEAANGTTLHFEIPVQDAEGKTKPKTITVSDPIATVQKALKGRSVF